MALPVPEIDSGAEEALRSAERTLADAEREAVDLREAGLAGEQRDAQMRRAREARRAELEGARRRAADAERRLAQQSAAAAEANRRAADADSARAECDRTLRRGGTRGAIGRGGGRGGPRGRHGPRESAWQEAAERAGTLGAELAGARSRHAALSESVRDGLDERTLRVARARGAQRLAEGLEVEPRLRLAVEAALGDALTGLSADARTALALRDARAVVLLPEAGPRPVREGETARGREAARAQEAATARGGGRLADALRRDPRGDVARLVARCVWVPDLESALDLLPVLPHGWSVVTLTGEVVRDDGLVRLGKRESVLERRAAAESAAGAVRGLEARLGEAVAARDAADATRREARSALERARAAVESARRTRRVADEADRSAARIAETAAREAAWQAAQLERIGAVAAAAGRELAEMEAAAAAGRATEEQGSGSGTDVERYRAQIAAMARRVRELGAARDRRAAEADEARRRRAVAEERHRRAEVGIALDSARLEELDREMARLVGAEADLLARLEAERAGLAAAEAEDRILAAELGALLESGRDERARLAATETAAAAARERLRSAEARARNAEVAEMELRLQLDAAREALMVELAGIGADGLAALLAETAPDATPGSVAPARCSVPAEDQDDLTPALEAALAAALAAWRSMDGPLPARTRAEGRARARRARARRARPRRATPAVARAAAERRPPGQPPPPVSRTRREQPVRRAGVRGGQCAAGDAGGAACRPGVRDPQHPGPGLDAEHAHRGTVPQDLFGAGGGLRPAIPPVVRRWRGPVDADGARGPLDDRRRDHRPPAREEAPAAGDALRWRAGADRGRAAAGDAGDPAGALLRPRRGRRGAGRGQYRALLERASWPGGADPVHRDHPQPGHDRGRRRALRRHGGRRRREPRRLAAARGSRRRRVSGTTGERRSRPPDGRDRPVAVPVGDGPGPQPLRSDA